MIPRNLLLALVVAGLAGCQPPLNAVPPPPLQPATAALEKVIAASPVRKKLQLFSNQPARLEAIEETPIHSKLAGYVAKVQVDVGDRVEAGQTLLTLALPEIEIELTQKEALVEQAQAETLQAKSAADAASAGIVLAEAQVAQARSGLGKAQADIARWDAEFSRISDLATSGVVNQQLVDETKQKLASAQAAKTEVEAAVAAARAAVTQAEAQVEKAKADVTAAAAKERVALANLDYAKTMLAYREIKAPFIGFIVERHVHPGHFALPAGADAQPLLLVSRTDKIRVKAAVPESEAGLVDVGDPLTIVVHSLKNLELPAVVGRTAFALGDGSRALETIVDLPNDDGRLRPGMYATARVLLAERENALVLPGPAVVRRDGGAFCFRIADGKAAETPIELGIKVGDEWEIVGGLDETVTVALNKAAALKDGQEVDASPPEAPKK
ncbi:MAG: efflux RND transporter periplasmic adaptor subunit [Pirellulaceae bacterium]|nr:efflux RND transporter periplasmic adaptor subunit [Pirellulaceae bacterium]